MMSKPVTKISEEEKRLIAEIEEFIRQLDDALSYAKGKFAGVALSTIEVKLSSLTAPFIGHMEQLGPEAFVVYEAQALVKIAKRDFDGAYSDLKKAQEKKGDHNFISQKARSIKLKVHWTTKDTIAVIAVGLFWLIGMIVLARNTTLPKSKKYAIMIYGTLLFVALSILASIIK